MLKYALKEWAVVCRALAAGRQSIIFRKGGLDDRDGQFEPQQKSFWLYPTYVHQARAAIKPEAVDFFDQAHADRPAPGTVRLFHFAEVTAIYHLHEIAGAFLLAPYHIYAEETVQSRFAYRNPGLYALVLRVYRAHNAIELPESARYAGCRSWVELDQELSTEGATPVLDDVAFERLATHVDHLLHPTALA
jgi:hypothetical protein